MDSPGRPSLYRPEFAGQAYGLCLLGATNQELADHFGVARSTIDKWRQDQLAFAQSLKRGRRLADAEVARTLHACALDYSYKSTRTVLRRGELVPMSCIVHCPPDVQAVPALSRAERHFSVAMATEKSIAHLDRGPLARSES